MDRLISTDYFYSGLQKVIFKTEEMKMFAYFIPDSCLDVSKHIVTRQFKSHKLFFVFAVVNIFRIEKAR